MLPVASDPSPPSRLQSADSQNLCGRGFASRRLSFPKQMTALCDTLPSHVILLITRSHVKAGCHKARRCVNVLLLAVCTNILHISLTCECHTLLPYTVRSHHYLTDPRLLTHTSSHVNCRALRFVRARLHRFRAIVRKQRAHIISSSPVKSRRFCTIGAIVPSLPSQMRSERAVSTRLTP